MTNDLLVVGIAYRFGLALNAVQLEGIASTSLIRALFWERELIWLDFGQPNLNAHEPSPLSRLQC
jgi:hypothetical protein